MSPKRQPKTEHMDISENILLLLFPIARVPRQLLRAFARTNVGISTRLEILRYNFFLWYIFFDFNGKKKKKL